MWQCLAQLPDFGLVCEQVSGPLNHLHNSIKDTTSGDQGSRRRRPSRSTIKDPEERRLRRSRSTNKKKEEAEEAQTSPSEPLRMRGTKSKASESQLENFLAAMVEQMRSEHEEMKTLLTALAPTQRTAVQVVSKDQYDQLSKDVQMFVSDEEVGHTFAYWYKRYSPVIPDSVLPDSRRRDLILMKLDEDAYRKY
ncbi:hypothetical protein RB195_020517 [Necator americanus]|uniref:DUF7083 domain-containing protein n=1 Tax=Necator americanus TaxID=51031 RepID=A0ABR1CK46_NECAM